MCQNACSVPYCGKKTINIDYCYILVREVEFFLLVEENRKETLDIHFSITWSYPREMKM